jgi:hypothetical protein
MPFEPGVSGNPGGRRKERPFRDALRKVLAELATDEAPAKPKTKLEVVARAHVEKAIAGDVPAIKEIADRLDGKVPQAVTNDDGSGEPFVIKIVKASDA